MKLWVLRHGEAQMQAATDAERPLTPDGVKQVQAQALRFGTQMAPAHVWVSPYVRAQQTARAWQKALPAAQPFAFETVDWLTPDTPVMQVVDQLGLRDESAEVLLISHQPLVSELVGFLTGEAAWACGMSTACLAELQLPLVARGLADNHRIHAPDLSLL
ncbi:phosphohistidine phosphatase SixA [Simiduia sp. 21SJ11W-1]|uniref:phosphohistidine phosphatase SixA n=1 Tax=Simiduia sp. 21SJ11W-1 TaxID=2909669 RepID=UPI00209EBE4E|nr:phosphohistidine phosphatase SixA [Simiduia sp. 21SJ11W-1]UTA46457.1 phosphohistidine phosphatase SixA [Simiduia sp. 21SJ11W-1]